MKHIKMKAYQPVMALGLVSLLLVGAFQNCSGQKLAFQNSSSLQRFSNPDIHYFRPALAIRNTNCIFCHASVEGNVITDLATNSGSTDQAQFLGSIAGVKGRGDYTFGNNFGWRASVSLTTNFIQGTIYMPRRMIDPRTLSAIIPNIQTAASTPMTQLLGYPQYPGVPATPIYQANIPTNFKTIASYANAVLNYRTSDYLNTIKNDPGVPKKADVVPDASIREILGVSISSPSADDLRTDFMTHDTMRFVRTPNGYDLSGLTRVNTSAGFYYANTAGSWMECDGDVFVDGIVYLKDLKLRTKTGCRIYATHTIFVDETPDTAKDRLGITYDDSVSSTPNLGLMSASAVIMGAGKCSNSSAAGGYGDSLILRSHDERTDNTPTLSGTGALTDYNQLISGGLQILDTGDCADASDARRSVAFNHLMINAPVIHSRYTSDIKGVLIAEHMVGSLGHFSYKYDPVFEAVSIFPVVPAQQYFQVQDCATYDPTSLAITSDQSHQVGNEAKFRSCLADVP